MADRDRNRPPDQLDRYGTFSGAVDLLRQGETVLTLIDPAARGRDPARFRAWLSARLAIADLPRSILPACDARCAAMVHDTSSFVVLSDLALDRADARPSSWWADWNLTLERDLASRPLWFAGAPALPVTPPAVRLTAGTRLRRLAVTDPTWVTYDSSVQETLFRIEDGARAGEALVGVSFGPSPLLPALAGVLIAPDHPPVHDRVVAARLLAAGWPIVADGLPYED